MTAIGLRRPRTGRLRLVPEPRTVHHDASATAAGDGMASADGSGATARVVF